MQTKYFNLDQTLEKIGFFGRYQIKSLLILILCIITSRIFGNIYMFHSLAINYRCLIPECESLQTAEYNNNWIKNAVPFSNGRPDHCLRYGNNETATNFCEPKSFDSRQTEDCNDQYVFEKKFVTIVKEFGLYCDRNLWKLSLTGTIYNSGSLAGMYMAGHISDKFGRKNTLIFAILISGSIVVSKGFFATTYLRLLVFEFIGAVAAAAIHISLFVLVTETLGSSHRLFGAFLMTGVATFSQGLLGLVALLVDDWRTLTKIAGVFPFAIMFYGWWLTESIRWLISKGEYAKANSSIKKMAKVNGVALSDEDLVRSEIDIGMTKPEVCHNFAYILKSTELSLRLIKLSFCWLSIFFVIPGITISSTALSPNFKINYILSCMIDVIANIFIYFISKYVGRKLISSFAFLFVGICCCAFISIEDPTLSLISFIFGKFSAAMATSALYIFTAELFPTPYRQRCLGVCSTFGRVGSMVAPQMPLLAAYTFETAPFAIFAVFGFAAGGLVFTLPETTGTELPATIAQAEKLKHFKN